MLVEIQWWGFGVGQGLMSLQVTMIEVILRNTSVHSFRLLRIHGFPVSTQRFYAVSPKSLPHWERRIQDPPRTPVISFLLAPGVKVIRMFYRFQHRWYNFITTACILLVRDVWISGWVGPAQRVSRNPNVVQIFKICTYFWMLPNKYIVPVVLYESKMIN